MNDAAFNLHGTCVCINGHGILIRGKPGSGKSELALRLIDAPGYGTGDQVLKAVLVADDQVLLKIDNRKLIARPPEALAGLLELRGQGILQIGYVTDIAALMVVDLAPAAEIERMPEKAALETEIGGIKLARIFLDRSQPAAPALVRAAFTNLLKQLP